MNFKKLTGFFHMSAPTICSGLAALGVIITGVLSAKAALKAEKTLNDSSLSPKEKVKNAAPAFAPPVIAGGATIVLIFAANVFGNSRQAALAAGFASLYKMHRENEDDMLNSANGGDESKGVLTFYEPISKRYFQRTMEEVIEAEYHTNRNFILRGHAPLNEFYEFLGLEKTDDGEKLGWSGEALWDSFDAAWIDFYHEFKTKGKLLPPRQITDSLHKVDDMRYVEMDVENRIFAECDCYVIQMPFEPMDNYLNYPFDD